MKQDLLLLHGAIGSAAQLEPLAEALQGQYNLHLLHFPGHGGTAMPDTFSIQSFAAFVQAYCARNNLKQVHLFGYSMGGYVGLYLAKTYPGLISKAATLATKWEWSESMAAKEISRLQPDVIAQKLPQFAATLQQRHAPNDWKTVLHKTAALLAGLGKENVLKVEDFSSIQTQTLLLLGDQDKMVSVEETLFVYQSMPNAQMGMLPATPHPVEAVDVSLLYFLLQRFFG